MLRRHEELVLPAHPASAGDRNTFLSVLKRRPSCVAIADQAILSVVSFGFSFLLARFIPIGDFGAYSLIASWTVVFTGIAEGLVYSPYVQIFRQVRPDQVPELSGSLFGLHSALCAIAVCIFVTKAIAFGGGTTSAILLAASLSVPLHLMREMIRRVLSAHLNYIGALGLDAASALFQFVAVGSLLLAGELSAEHVLIASAVANLIVVLVYARSVTPALSFSQDAIKAHVFRYSKLSFWNLAASITFLSQIFVVQWLFAGLGRNEWLGQYAICHTLVMLSNPLVQGVSNSLGPNAVSRLQEAGILRMKQYVMRGGLATAATLVPVVIAAVLIGAPAIQLLTGKVYEGQPLTLIILSVGALVRTVGLGPYLGLWAIGRSRSNCLVNLLALVITVPLVLFLTPTFGIVGAAVSACLGDIVSSLVRIVVLVRCDEA